MPRSAVYGKGRQGEAIDFNMTPMIDVTFQLIIFFILAGQMASQDLAQMLLHRPYKSQAIPTEVLGEEGRGGVVINIVSAAQDEKDPANVSPVMAATAKEYRVGKERIAAGDIDTLVTRLKERIRGRNAAEVIVEIRSDSRVCFAAVRPTMVAAAEAGFHKMNITAKVQMAE